MIRAIAWAILINNKERIHVKDILRNLALFTLVDYCRENKIDCSGSYLEYDGKFKFLLMRDESCQPLVSIQYSKNSRPLVVRYQ